MTRSLLCCFALAGCTTGSTGHGFAGAATEGKATTSADDDDDDEDTASDESADDEGTKLDLYDPNGPGTCADVTAEITPGEATVTLLLDQSGTMTQSLGGSGIERWDAVFQTLLDPASGVVAGYESDIKFGMTLYTNDAPAGCPDLTVVDPGFDNRAAMASEFQMAVPLGDTPTGESLLAVGQALAALDDGSTKGVILATDGEPDTCACPNACAGASKGVAIEAAQQLYDMGIQTFVIAVGDSITDLQHLQHLANVGAGRASYFDDPMYDEWTDPWVDDTAPANPATLFTANDPAALEDAFGSLIAGFVPCDFTVNGTIEDIQKACEAGTVTLDGTELACPDDWEVIDETTLTLVGEACQALQDGEAHEVEATFPCDVINVG